MHATQAKTRHRDFPKRRSPPALLIRCTSLPKRHRPLCLSVRRTGLGVVRYPLEPLVLGGVCIPRKPLSACREAVGSSEGLQE